MYKSDILIHMLVHFQFNIVFFLYTLNIVSLIVLILQHTALFINCDMDVRYLQILITFLDINFVYFI